MQRPVTREPWHKSGDDEGPKSPDVKRPDPSDLLKRMRRVDPGWPDVGTRIHHSVGLWPLLINDHTEVLEMRTGQFLRLRARAWPVGAAEVAITLTPNGGHTDVRLEEAAVSGPGSLIPPPVEGLSLRLRNAEALRRLANIAERQA